MQWVIQYVGSKLKISKVKKIHIELHWINQNCRITLVYVIFVCMKNEKNPNFILPNSIVRNHFMRNLLHIHNIPRIVFYNLVQDQSYLFSLNRPFWLLTNWIFGHHFIFSDWSLWQFSYYTGPTVFKILDLVWIILLCTRSWLRFILEFWNLCDCGIHITYCSLTVSG